MEKKNGGNVLKLILIFCGGVVLGILGLIGYQSYIGYNNNSVKVEEQVEENNKDKKQEDETKEIDQESEKELEVSNAEVNEMIKIIDYLPYYAKSSKDIKNEDLLFIGYLYSYAELSGYEDNYSRGEGLKDNILKIFNRSVSLEDIACPFNEEIWLKYNANNDYYDDTEECGGEFINSRRYHQVVSSSRVGETYTLVLNSLYTEFCGSGRTESFYLTIDDAYQNENELNVDYSYLDERESWDINKIFSGFKSDLKEEIYTFKLINGNITFDSYIIK